MTVTQIVFGASLIVILLALAGYTGWKQWHVLRWANAEGTLSPEDLKYYRRQSSRRLICAVLMLALAGVLIGSFFFEDRAQELANKVQEARQRGEEAELNVEDLRFRDFYGIGARVVLVHVARQIKTFCCCFRIVERVNAIFWLVSQSDAGSDDELVKSIFDRQPAQVTHHVGPGGARN